MIPFAYRLRKEIRFKKDTNTWLVVSETPLSITRVNERAVKILKLCNGKRTPSAIAEIIRTEEDHVFKLCMLFNKKGILEIKPAWNTDFFPSVSVIIPTKDRETETIECLKSVYSQNYPRNKIEVIIVDDGSAAGPGNYKDKFPCRVISLPVNHGQSFCRNLGAKKAKGEILAFIDSDCIASKSWLREVTSYFQWKNLGAVGGFVDGYYNETCLDRYEKKFSSLNLGKHFIYDTGNKSTFYVPTCNLLVRRKVYADTGGIQEDMHIGEDVDFCWRMRDKNYGLLYVPYGIVKHKHRSSPGKMLKRRMEYGTSESILYGVHKEKKKNLIFPPAAGISFLGLCIAVLSMSWQPVLLSIASLFFESIVKARRIANMRLEISPWKILFSVLRVFFSYFYFISFHLIRYYMLLFLLAGIFFHPVWLLCLFMAAVSSCVDYFIKKPDLIFPVFLFYYLMEHISYQAGVFAGCLQNRNFRSYRTGFSIKNE